MTNSGRQVEVSQRYLLPPFSG